MSSTLSLASPLAIFVIISMFLYWIISGVILFLLYRFGNRKTKTSPKSISDKSYDMRIYDRGLSRTKVGPAATGV